MGYMGILLQYTQSHILSTEGGLQILGCRFGRFRMFSYFFGVWGEGGGLSGQAFLSVTKGVSIPSHADLTM